MLKPSFPVALPRWVARGLGLGWMAKAWNKQQEQGPRELRPGDTIIQVNAALGRGACQLLCTLVRFGGSDEMLQECRNKMCLGATSLLSGLMRGLLQGEPLLITVDAVSVVMSLPFVSSHERPRLLKLTVQRSSPPLVGSRANRAFGLRLPESPPPEKVVTLGRG